MNILAELFIWSVNIPDHYNAFWKPILDYLKIEDTNFFNGFSYFASFLFIGWFYYLLIKSAQYIYLLKWLCIALCVFQVFNYFIIDGFRAKGAVGLILSSANSMALSALYLWYLSNKPPNLSIWKNPYFWISGSIFIISTLSLVYSFSAETLYESDFVLYCKTKIIKNGVNMLGELAFLISFTKAKNLKYL